MGEKTCNVQPATCNPPAARNRVISLVFAGLFGGFLGLSLLKFGNPPIMERWVTKPNGFYEFLLGYPWPITWAYGFLVLVAVVGLRVARPNRSAPAWLVCLPLLWLGWQ